MALVFPGAEALQAVLRAGLISAEVQRAPVKFARHANGDIEIEPSQPIGVSQQLKLKNAGVVERAPSAELLAASCWAATVAPRAVGEPEAVPALVLFVLPRADQLAALCGELLRLGCDRQELQLLGDGRALIRVREPPFYVVARAAEGDGLHVFVPTPKRQDAVWTELGYVHPLADLLDAPTSGVLLIRGSGAFEPIAVGAWTPLDSIIVPAGIPVSAVLTASQLPRIEVRLALSTSGRREEPSMWLLPEGFSAVESLVRHSPEAALEAVMFAVAGTLVVLKARPGREKSIGGLPGVPYARLNELPNLYAPVGATIEPPLSRERVREWLAGDTEQVSWLTGQGESFARQSLPEHAFRPLTEWVEYVIDTSQPALTAWEQSATFDFDDFIGVELVPAPERPREDDDGEPVKNETRRAAKRKTPERPSSRELPNTVNAAVEVRRIEPSQLEQELQNEEGSFLELDAPADSPERVAAWMRLARLYQALGQDREAGLAWSHAAWEAAGPEAVTVARGWSEAVGASLTTLLAVGSPSQEQTRFVVAQLLALAEAGDTRVRVQLPQVQAWLDTHDENLDVRSMWLGRYALAKLSGGDSLALARARDRVLTRLRRGLSLERDVPRFLRAAGPGSSRDAARVERVTLQLEQLLKAFDETPRKRSPIEAPWPLTRAYIGLELAWGFARLGDVRRARALEEAALKVLDTKNPVNSWLTRGYQARIAQASEGLPPDAPLPPELGSALNALEPFPRFRVDRLRQVSTVLEPQARLEPFGLFKRQSADVRGEELAALREVHDPGQLAAAIDERTRAALDPQLPPEERARLLYGLLDFLPKLPESACLPLLNKCVTLADTLPARLRMQVLEDALKVAGHFGRGPLVRQLVMTLSGLLSELGTEGAMEVGAALSASVRSMRRVGLRDEAAQLLQRAAQVLKGEDGRALSGRLAVAAGFAYLSRIDAVTPIVEEGIAFFNDKSRSLVERLKVARAVARTLANTPTDFALPRLLRLTSQLPSITDQFNTNDFFCLSMVDFADVMVIGHVGEDLTLSDLTRSFLEEDEYLVRRRVHRDAGQG